jgi:hypothetical protein
MSLAARQAKEEGNKGRVAPTKVKRYWPGKAPEWADGGDADDGLPAAVAAVAVDEAARATGK